MSFKMRIRRFLIKVLDMLPEKMLMNYILLESKPDLSDNTRAVFDEMIKRGLNRKYKIIWLVSNRKHKICKIKNVKYVYDNGIKKYWYRLFCKCIICCNGRLFSIRRGQFTIYLGHAITVKHLRVPTAEPMPERIDWWLCTSDEIKDDLFIYELLLSRKALLSNFRKIPRISDS